MIARAALAIVVVLCAVARADDRREAKRLYDEGLARYDAGEYDAAITAWSESYRLSKAPLLLFNLGQAYRLSGDCTKAMQLYAEYEHVQPPPANRDELDAATALCRDRAATDATTAAPKPPVTSTTPHDDGAAIAKRAPPPRRSRDTRIYGYVVMGLGAAFGGAAAYFAVDGAHLARTTQGVTSWVSSDNSYQSRGNLDNALAWTFGAAAVVSVGTGIALYVIGAPREPAITVAPTRGGAAITFARAF